MVSQSWAHLKAWLGVRQARQYFPGVDLRCEVLAALCGPAVRTEAQSKVSMMPEGLDRALTVRDCRDLMAFLMSRK
jgi:hypothetical protein